MVCRGGINDTSRLHVDTWFQAIVAWIYFTERRKGKHPLDGKAGPKRKDSTQLTPYVFAAADSDRILSDEDPVLAENAISSANVRLRGYQMVVTRPNEQTRLAENPGATSNWLYNRMKFLLARDAFSEFRNGKLRQTTNGVAERDQTVPISQAVVSSIIDGIYNKGAALPPHCNLKFRQMWLRSSPRSLGPARTWRNPGGGYDPAAQQPGP
ncbi:hypothetical protein MAPG_04711 [Magnaporthiopsis poae ATCC 64411]|uniref:Uncharacterized protein n=1 Tax=Magnaporthiopsis poae (strain ATCC 64411 / 73-15) TaxID=644358 RepID=A0A0C4DXF7_MAGP6|nr:hypothetical protein MAPG_04711 [Magnaporthiopsis poae ATCC 64411]